MTRNKVNSSSVAEMGHDADQSELHVVYKTGNHVYIYPCTAEEYQRLLAAPSLGAHLNQLFRNRTHRKRSA